MFENADLLKTLECAICCEVLCDPRELVCYHCFCKCCLDDYLQFNGDGSAILQCPNKCEGITEIKDNETASSLKVNFTLKGFLEHLKGVKKINPPPCNGKDDCDNLVSFSCSVCSKKLCKDCKDEHLCEDNHFVHVKFDGRSAELEAFCRTHQSYFKHVCMDCGEKLICTYCYHRAHKKHKSRTLENHAMEMQSWFLSQVRDVEKCFTKANISYVKEFEKFDDFEKILKEELKKRKVKLLCSFLKKFEKEEQKILDTLKQKKEEYACAFGKLCPSSGDPLQRLQSFAQELESKKNYEILSENSQIGRKFQSLSLIHCVEGELINGDAGSSLGSLNLAVFTTSCPENAVDLKIQKKVYANDVDHLIDVNYLKEYIEDVKKTPATVGLTVKESDINQLVRKDETGLERMKYNTARKDLTNEILKKKQPTTTGGYSASSSAPHQVQEKAKVQKLESRVLEPCQRVSASNDFNPNFMRQVSSGGSSGDGESCKPGNVCPTKVLQAPTFEKIVLKKSEDASVRPSEKAKDLTEDQSLMDKLERNVRSILNKLTPQKFKTLVDQMLDLKIDSLSQLEAVVDLIYEKAVSEPLYSVAYANMCRVLTDQFKVPIKGDKPAQSTVTFRKMLLNKCQKEFEKQSSDELLEEDRQKSSETEEEKKAWMEELNYREMMNRRRMLGNIRFIGELFKLKMISENIIHDCIFKLMHAEKQESLQDQLECLCTLLCTVGKDLDHQKAKPRMDQYFVEINKIIEKKKISARIRCALRDIIDLRKSNWVPRRDDGNPKTIDQIHREAQQKEKQEEIARQQEKLQRQSVRGRGGRDSPVVRTNAPPTADGWTNVPSSKGNRQTQTPVDASKFKLQKKTDSSEISLVRGGRPGVWSRGASGVSCSGSGSNTPTSDLDRPTNQFNILAESNVTPASLDNKREYSIYRKQILVKSFATPTGGCGRDERNAALRALKDMTGRSRRNQSPARSSPSDDVSSAPSSGAQTPVEKSLSPNPISEDKMRKTTVSTLEEFFSIKDMKEADLCIKELNASHLHPTFVEEATSLVLQKKLDQRRLVGELFNEMIKKQTLSIDHMCQGFNVVVQLAQDLACDVPLIYTYLGEIIGPVVYDGTLPLNRLKDSLEPLVQLNKAGIVMAQALSVAVQIAGTEDSVSTLWSESSLKWEMLFKNANDVQQFLKDKKMEFTLSTPTCSYASQVQDEMRRLLKENKDVNNQVMSLIQTKVPPEVQNTTEFIKSLTKTICNSTLLTDCTCNKDTLRDRSKLLLRYVNNKKDFELHALYGMQELVTELNHPRELLQVLFEELYDTNVISEETFYVWENSKEFPEGKGNAVSCVRGFLQWLRKAEEEY